VMLFGRPAGERPNKLEEELFASIGQQIEEKLRDACAFESARARTSASATQRYGVTRPEQRVELEFWLEGWFATRIGGPDTLEHAGFS